MDKPVRDGEIRLTIRPADAPGDSSRLIPADVFKQTFSTFLRALKIADAALHDKSSRSGFLISDLQMGSNVVAIYEQSRATEKATALVQRAVSSVYRSDFQRAAESDTVARAVVALGRAVNVQYPALAEFANDEIPLDRFFAEQAKRFSLAISQTARQSLYFAGNTIGAFEGTMGNIDYRGATWLGHLVLPGAGVQIECVFDKAKGEDAFNPYGNKRVSVRGRAIYTGDSQLPERIEVMTVDEIPHAQEAISIKGSLSGNRYFDGGDGGGNNLQ
ncbi:MAG: hypothetical protein ACK4S3_08800 [Parvibaculum sp.]